MAVTGQYRGAPVTAPLAHASAAATDSAGAPLCVTTRLLASDGWFCTSVSCRPSRTASTVMPSEDNRNATMYGACSEAPSGPPTAGPIASASCFTRAKAELY